MFVLFGTLLKHTDTLAGELANTCYFASLFACLLAKRTLLMCFYLVNGLQEYNRENLSSLTMYFMTKHLSRGGLFASLCL